MADIAHPIPAPQSESRSWLRRIRVPEMWASLAIAVIWLAVLFDAILGPDFVSTSASGNFTRIPSVVFVVVFAYLGTRVVARYGFGTPRDSSG
jgi:hypothetical protein